MDQDARCTAVDTYVAALGRIYIKWILRDARVATPLHAPARSVAQRGLYYGARQGARRDPLPSLRNESRTRVDNSLIAGFVGYVKDWRNDRLYEGKLLPFEAFCVEATLTIERKNGERVPDNAHRGSGGKFDEHLSHPYPLPRECRETVAHRFSQHPVKLCVRQSPERIVPGNEKSSTGQTHGWLCPPVSIVRDLLLYAFGKLLTINRQW